MENNIDNIAVNEFCKNALTEIYNFIDSVGGILNVRTKNAIEDLFYEHGVQFNEDNTLITTYTRSDIDSLQYSLQITNTITIRNDNNSTFLSMKPEVYYGDMTIQTHTIANYNSIEDRKVNVCDETVRYGDNTPADYFICLITTNSLQHDGLFRTTYDIIIYVPEYNVVSNMEQYLEAYDVFTEDYEE